MEHSVVEFLEAHDAFWQWDGHKHVAELTSGKLSDFFANCTPIFTDPHYQDDFCRQLVKNEVFPIPGNKWVIGSAMGAIGLAQSIARFRSTKAAYTEPVDGKMILKRFDLGEKPHVILCEDVITTGGTTRKTVAGILEAHPDAVFHPRILCVVNRSRRHSIECVHEGQVHDLGIESLIHAQPNVWDTVADLPENMKDCVPIRPKANWRALADEKL